MTTNIEENLNNEVENFPSRASGEDLYEYINRAAIQYIQESRAEFIVVMMHWLQLRSEPKTMLAVDVAGNNRLDELRGALEELLEEVNKGKVFKPFYERPINKALKKL